MQVESIMPVVRKDERMSYTEISWNNQASYISLLMIKAQRHIVIVINHKPGRKLPAWI